MIDFMAKVGNEMAIFMTLLEMMQQPQQRGTETCEDMFGAFSKK